MPKSKGFTLVEVLISLVIFSFGALGLITLQIKATQSSQHQFLQAKAAVFLQDMTERLRSNREAAKEHLWNDNDATPVDCIAKSCSNKEMLTHDYQQWITQVKNELPQASFSSKLKNDVYTLSLYWNSPINEASCNKNIKNKTLNNCLAMEVQL